MTQLQGYVQSNLDESVSTGSFITLSRTYAAALNDTSLSNTSVADRFVVRTIQIDYLLTVSPTTIPTVSPSSPTYSPTKGAETYVNFDAMIKIKYSKIN